MVGKLLQSLELRAWRRVESPLPAGTPHAPGREKTCHQVGGPRGMPWGRFGVRWIVKWPCNSAASLPLRHRHRAFAT